MTKKIETLIEDIYGLMGSGHTPDPAHLDELGKAMASHIARALAKPEPRASISASNIGHQCDRYTWLSEHRGETKETFDPWVQLKLLYGHLLEEMTLFFAQEAGHSVEARQQTVYVDGVEGHFDAVIDGEVVDVKSANSRSMHKFKKHSLENDDPFNYLDQVSFYYESMKDDPRVTSKQVAFLVIDKELGHLVLDRYTPKATIRQQVQHKKDVICSKEQPARGFFAEPDGKSGNMQLGTVCKYCAFKTECWPGMRTFLYSNGPRFLTRVVREPDVKELRSADETKGLDSDDT